MKHFKGQLALGVVLITLSAGLYFLHYRIFGDAHHIFIYLLGDIAFIPIELLLVTMIIQRLLEEREKSALREKMNLVIGAFFSEAGTGLLKSFSRIAPCSHGLGKEMAAITDWSAQDFTLIAKKVKKCDCQVAVQQKQLEELHDLFQDKRDFLLRLLENPNLLEHDAFAELLWAVFHLAEELDYRPDFKQLSQEDYAHLSKDLKRAYTLLVFEWLAYMKHLKQAYPYLFSLAIRTNPFFAG